MYRKRVGEAFIEKYELDDDYPDWDKRWSSIPRDRSTVRDEEYILERRVSTYLREQPFLWVNIDDEPSSGSDRAHVERNAIALLSNFNDQTIDARSQGWIGRYSQSREIRESGLWNVSHVEEQPDPAFIDQFAEAVNRTDFL